MCVFLGLVIKVQCVLLVVRRIENFGSCDFTEKNEREREKKKKKSVLQYFFYKNLIFFY